MLFVWCFPYFTVVIVTFVRECWTRLHSDDENVLGLSQFGGDADRVCLCVCVCVCVCACYVAKLGTRRLQALSGVMNESCVVSLEAAESALELTLSISHFVTASPRISLLSMYNSTSEHVFSCYPEHSSWGHLIIGDIFRRDNYCDRDY